MARYRVTLIRTITETATIYVDADTADDAGTIALIEAEEHDWDTMPLDDGDGYAVSVDVASAEEE